MLTPLPLGIGLRYVRSRRQSYFVSFITWVSLAGVCLGVAALITILSVMNGLEGELRQRLLALSAHATYGGVGADPAALEALAARLRAEPEVVAAAPFIEVEGLASSGPYLAPTRLRGIDVAAETAVGEIAKVMVSGSLGALAPGSNRVVLGRILAADLGVGVGDRITVLLPRTEAGGALEPQIGAFEVAGLFEAGLADHDASLALAALADVAAFAGPEAPAGVHARFSDVVAAPALSRAVAGRLPGVTVRDWTEDHAAYFQAIRLEKLMMTVMLLLIVAVAAFNIVASLVMVVSEKRKDIAILRTLGLGRGSVSAIFLTQGTLIGWVGTAAGIALGLVLAYNAGAIAAAVEQFFGFHVFDPSVYYISSIPSEVRGGDVAVVAVAAFILTLAAAVYPALRASHTQPAEALRYE
ncbi:MAG: lipoprotein-releasing ABC transporter permease subunit [Steroidobacteraceae bacterium]|jgi:lipoprotein-releasing system permease protein|nr:lipoprotein-releasing ABC transporter permease subunit [Steroidobacteraceae bacterium]